MSQERTEFDEVVRVSWDRWLQDFKRDMLPVFEAHGFSADAALIAFQINTVTNAIQTEADDDEPWRGA
jgi:hypothetical protein